MTGFRGDDERLDREIEATERIARLRVRRFASELRLLERELRELRRERARRRAAARELIAPPAMAEARAASD
ncbi:MAG: hypothetical protein L3K04_03085 [Thermoplasmata archaeon]|nr:hypothetical protein [Thermoplasmata archaeon]